VLVPVARYVPSSPELPAEYLGHAPIDAAVTDNAAVFAEPAGRHGSPPNTFLDVRDGRVVANVEISCADAPLAAG
jgi:hypothetical protein